MSHFYRAVPLRPATVGRSPAFFLRRRLNRWNRGAHNEPPSARLTSDGTNGRIGILLCCNTRRLAGVAW